MRSETAMHPGFPTEGSYPVVTPEPNQVASQARVGRVYLIDIWGNGMSEDKRDAVSGRSVSQNWRALSCSVLVVN